MYGQWNQWKCMRQLVLIRHFQNTQKLVSRGWCFGSWKTPTSLWHTQAGRAACTIKLVIHCMRGYRKFSQRGSKVPEGVWRKIPTWQKLIIWQFQGGGGGGGSDPLSPLWICPCTDWPVYLEELVYLEETQNIVSGGWCMDSKDTNQPVAGRAACSS